MNASLDTQFDSHSNPFDLSNEDAYQSWRSYKLAHLPSCIEDLVVKVEDIDSVSDAELTALKARILQNNMVVYDFGDQAVTKAQIRQFSRKVGLDRIDNNICSDEDSITSLEVSDEGQKRVYIPYTNRRLSWHCDGYYNTLDHQIRGMMLHCARPAAEGGENMLLDHEMLYIQLRDENPDYIRALMREDVMTIPANNESPDGEQIRGDQTGPVFSLENGSGNLHMRYSARTRNISWYDDEITEKATKAITRLLDESPYIIQYRLKAGQGVICNNVLHNRTSFEDSETQHRLLYRARFYDRVADTNVADIMTAAG